MKAGLGTSITLHAALLAAGLVVFKAPSAFEVDDVESLPVAIIPFEDITQLQQGEKDAPAEERPAPKPVQNPNPLPESVNIGETLRDVETQIRPEVKPKEIAKTATPVEQPEPVKVPDPEPDPVPKPEVKETPKAVASPEVKPEPVPQEEVKPDPVAETIEETEPEAIEVASLPTRAPRPVARPRPPQPQTAKTPERRNNERPKAETKVAEQSTEKSLDDEVSELLNREETSGGAKASTRTAALGGDKPSPTEKLSTSEIDALRAAIKKCWSLPPGADSADDISAVVNVELNKAGEVVGRPEVNVKGASGTLRNAMASAGVRAIKRCAPYKLPADKYADWKDVGVTFTPEDFY